MRKTFSPLLIYSTIHHFCLRQRNTSVLKLVIFFVYSILSLASVASLMLKCATVPTVCQYYTSRSYLLPDVSAQINEL